MRTSNTIISKNVQLSGSFNSDPFSIIFMSGFSVSAVWEAGTPHPVGELSLQVSNSHERNIDNVPEASWATMDDSETALSGSDNIIMYNVKDQYAKYLRVAYAVTSGSGSMNVTLNAKGY